MGDKPELSPQVIRNAEIIFAEFYYSINGHPCPPDVWQAAFEAWKAEKGNLHMVDAAVSAARAIDKGEVRSVRKN